MEIQLTVAGALQQSTPVTLSEREVAIMRLVADGASNREIGVQLGLSEPRIKQHIADIFAKLGANDCAHAVALAIRSGLLRSSQIYSHHRLAQVLARSGANATGS